MGNYCKVTENLKRKKVYVVSHILLSIPAPRAPSVFGHRKLGSETAVKNHVVEAGPGLEQSVS